MKSIHHPSTIWWRLKYRKWQEDLYGKKLLDSKACHPATFPHTNPLSISKSLSEDFSHPNDHTRQTTDTPGFKPFTVMPQTCVNYFLFFLIHSLVSLQRMLPQKSKSRVKNLARQRHSRRSHQ